MKDGKFLSRVAVLALSMSLYQCAGNSGPDYGDVPPDNTSTNQTSSSIPLVSGRVARAASAGARPKIGQIALQLSGTNGNADYLIYTNADGDYAALVPMNWTGVVRAADAEDTVLAPAQRTISSPVIAPVEHLDFEAWTAPIGVPAPEFGIVQQAPARPNPWSQEVAGYYYVDQYASNSSDQRTYGTPTQPRQHMPTTLPAGSVVEVHGNYDWAPQGYIPLFLAQGTFDRPVFIRGQNAATRARLTKDLGPANGSSYVIIENINFDGAGVMIADSHHVVLRNSEIQNTTGSIHGAHGIGVGGSTNPASHVVVYNNKVHNSPGFWSDPDLGDFDRHGIKPYGRANNIWVIDNEFYNNGGNAMQIGDYGGTPSNLHHIYFSRNILHHNRQASLGVKNCMDIIVTQNVVYSDRFNESPGGSCLGAQYSFNRLWFMFNEIYDNQWAIGIEDATGDIYFIGNVIHDVTNRLNYDPQNPHLASAAIRTRGGSHLYAVNNTIYNVAAGLNDVAIDSYEISNNIISGVNNGETALNRRGTHVWLFDEQGDTDWQLRNNVLYNNATNPEIRWRSGIYTVPQIQQAQPVRAQGNVAGNPLFVNPQAGNFRLQPGSPAIDTGRVSGVYSTFASTYGVNIARDFDNVIRPQDGAWDAGAFELSDTTPCQADLNQDHLVNLADLALLLSSFGTSGAGDIDGNGMTDSADLAILLSEFGQNCQ